MGDSARVRRAAVAATIALLAAGGYAAYRVARPVRDGAPPERPWRIEVEPLPRPVGATGAAVHVAARDAVAATVWEDGAVTVRRGGAVLRAPPPSDDERYRRAAVAPDGAVLAITSRGRIVEVRPEGAIETGLKTQSGSLLAAGPSESDAWSAGERGTLRRFDRRARTASEPWEAGAPPFTALAVGPSVVVAGGIDGGVLRGQASGGAGREWLRLDGAVSALVVTGDWVAAGSERGRIAVGPAHGVVPATPAHVEGGVVGLAFPARDAAGSVERTPILVVHEPGTVTLLAGSLYERATSAALGATPRAACALDDGSLLVATSEGEKVVRARRAP